MIAETVAQAKDAAEAVTLDIEPLPAVLSAREAVKPGAPQLCDDVPGNIALDYHFGDSREGRRSLRQGRACRRGCR